MEDAVVFVVVRFGVLAVEFMRGRVELVEVLLLLLVLEVLLV